MTSAQGVDVSSYQRPLDTSVLHGVAFAFAKATNGAGGADPHFAENWAAIRAADIHRGAYHELTGEDPAAQAAWFLRHVTAQLLNPGDMLACVASDYNVSGAAVREFCDEVRKAVGPRYPVLVYSDESRLRSLAEAASYPLWLAWYELVPPGSVSPWASWTLWQWQAGGGADGGDRDAFNGDAVALDAWIASYQPKPPPPVNPPGAPSLSVTGHANGANLGWSVVPSAPERKGGREYAVEITGGPTQWGTRTVAGQHLHADLAPGHYQARVRAAGDAHAPWSLWHAFTVTA